MKKYTPLLAIIMVSCVYPHYAQPVTTTQANNNDEYKVSYLFEYGGCKVYRFYDGGYGNIVYYTNCGGETTSFGDSTQVRSTGFNNNNPVNISTYTRIKDSGFYKYKEKPVDVSSFKENR